MSTQTNETDTPNFPEEKNGADARHFGYVIQNPLPPSLTVDNGGGGKNVPSMPRLKQCRLSERPTSALRCEKVTSCGYYASSAKMMKTSSLWQSLSNALLMVSFSMCGTSFPWRLQWTWWTKSHQALKYFRGYHKKGKSAAQDWRCCRM